MSSGTDGTSPDPGLGNRVPGQHPPASGHCEGDSAPLEGFAAQKARHHAVLGKWGNGDAITAAYKGQIPPVDKQAVISSLPQLLSDNKLCLPKAQLTSLRPPSGFK